MDAVARPTLGGHSSNHLKISDRILRDGDIHVRIKGYPCNERDLPFKINRLVPLPG